METSLSHLTGRILSRASPVLSLLTLAGWVGDCLTVTVAIGSMHQRLSIYLAALLEVRNLSLKKSTEIVSIFTTTWFYCVSVYIHSEQGKSNCNGSHIQKICSIQARRDLFVPTAFFLKHTSTRWVPMQKPTGWSIHKSLTNSRPHPLHEYVPRQGASKPRSFQILEVMTSLEIVGWLTGFACDYVSEAVSLTYLPGSNLTLEVNSFVYNPSICIISQRRK